MGETQLDGTADEYLNGAVSNLASTFQDFQLLESDEANVIFSGQSGYRFFSTYQHNDTTYLRMETGAIIDDKPFFAIYDVNEEKYSKYEPLVNLMLESLENPPESRDRGCTGWRSGW